MPMARMNDGKRLDGVDHPHQELVEPAPAIARHRAEHGAQRQRDGRRGEGHEQVDAPGVDDARELVAAVEIGAEPVPAARRLERVLGVGRVRVVGHDHAARRPRRAPPPR